MELVDQTSKDASSVVCSAAFCSNHHHDEKEVPTKRRRLLEQGIPTLRVDPKTGRIPYESFRSAYEFHQVIYIPQAVDSSKRTFSWRDVHALFESLKEDDRKSWCIENEANKGPADKISCDPSNFLTCQTPSRGYCSFLVQKDEAVLERLLKDQLPVVDLPLTIEEKTNLIETQETESLPIKYDEEDEPCVSTKEEHDTNCVKLSYGPCLWFFFGRNVANDTVSPMLGRPEHTDSVSHDGTWHYQLSGTKTWHLRPTEELLQHQQEASGIDDGKQHPNISVATDITCQEGDILLVNTRLWWHRTTIPSQVGIDKKNKGSGEVPSVSYARDVYLSKNAEEQEETQTDPVMTNVDGLYASANIEAGTIIFTEADMPDCELHRSKTNPNCEVVELEDGTGALVSCCDIKTGDFFCVLESDDDDTSCDESIEEEEEEEDHA